MQTIPVLQFNGGMTPDARGGASECQICKHFDNFTKSHSLIPYKDSESGYASQSTDKLQSFLMYNSKLYALGVVSGQNYAKIFETSDIGNPNFVASTTGADGGGTTDFTMFVEYKGVLYGASAAGASGRIWSYTISSNTFSAGTSVAYSNITQGLVHSKDDILYVAYNYLASGVNLSYIASKNGAGGWNMTALTLPSNLIPTSICEYGNYLAIACRPLYPNSGNSKVFLWDRNSSLTTLSESIDFGNRDLYALENLDGYLIGVSIQTAYSSSFNTKLVFQKYSGGGAIVFKEHFFTTSSVTVVVGKQKVNNRLYFGVTGSSVGGVANDFTAIWSVGRNGETTPFSVQIDRLPNNDTVATQIKGFILVQDFMYISSLDGSSAFQLMKTNDQTFYTTTSIYRTTINPNMPNGDKIQLKKLISANLTYEPISASTQCVLKYRVDGGSFTTIFTETTTNAKSTKRTSAVGVAFTDGEDYEFEIQSQGVTVTGLFYEYDKIPT